MLLNCHTYYSLRYGTFSIEQLLDCVQKAGYTNFVLTDINNTSAVIDYVALANQKGWAPKVGVDFRNGVHQKYIAIAKNNDGFKELNEHLSHHLHHEILFNDQAPVFQSVFVIYPFSDYKGWALLPNEYIGVSTFDLQKLSFQTARMPLEKCVMLNTVSFESKKDYNAHRLLRAIEKNILLSKLTKDEQAKGNEYIIPMDQVMNAYKDYPILIQNTAYILQHANIEFDYGKLSNKNLKSYTNSLENDIQLLRKLAVQKIGLRYKNPTQEIYERIEKELEVISQLKFASYFLINWDIISYAKRKNYFYVGRGSGANSIVAYLLEITNVDPIELDLYFERFINLYRNNAPDFDMDFSWTDRDDITRYIFEKFGKERTALLGSYNTFQHDAIIRELGKVFGLTPADIDRLQNIENKENAGEFGRLVLTYGEYLKGFPSHLSIHSSGILISEEPITQYSATFIPPKGYPTTQFSMLEAEDIGLYKFDILSQRGLGKIKDSVALVKKNKQIEIDINDINRFKQDDKVKTLLSKGNTIGCFYVESPAMRMLLTKLKASDYLRLVAASSIIRPGVAKSGMMREYIIRFQHEHLREQARKSLPELYEILEETYGVMVYQEDVIKVAHIFAGLSLMEADYLRRGMSWKYKKKNEFEKVKQNFFKNCAEKGYSLQTIQDTWNQIESFGNFAFSKGHSASYAVESYQALFLKAYYPLEYLVATLNNGGGYYKPELYIHEARVHGATIQAPCINHGEIQASIQGNNIILGFQQIQNLDYDVQQKIVEEREAHGLFSNLMDAVNRLPIGLEQFKLLIQSGCFAFTNRKKQELLWEIHSLFHHQNHKKSNLTHPELFPLTAPNWKFPELDVSLKDEAYDELQMFGFTLISPFLLLDEPIRSSLLAKDFPLKLSEEVFIVAYLISVKHTRTSKGERMYFGTFIDQAGDWVDTVHFPPSASAFPFRGPGCYEIIGKVVSDFDFINLEVSAMKRLATVNYMI